MGANCWFNQRLSCQGRRGNNTSECEAREQNMSSGHQEPSRTKMTEISCSSGGNLIPPRSEESFKLHLPENEVCQQF